MSAAVEGAGRPGSTLLLLGLRPPGNSLRSLTRLRASRSGPHVSQRASPRPLRDSPPPRSRGAPWRPPSSAPPPPSVLPLPGAKRRRGPPSIHFWPACEVDSKRSAVSAPTLLAVLLRSFGPPFSVAMVSDAWKPVKATLRVGLRPSLDGPHGARAPTARKAGLQERRPNTIP